VANVDQRFIKPALSPIQLGLIGAALLIMGLIVGIVGTLVYGHWSGTASRNPPQLADIAGEWRITYPNGREHFYRIQASGRVMNDWRTGLVRLQGDTFVVTFDDDGKREHLTLGTDGRLFVEPDDPIGLQFGDPASGVGIGVRRH
jgi:hypothetical protein